MAVTKWMTLVQQCLLRRLSVAEFAQLLETQRDSLEGVRLFSALFDCRESFCVKGDPLISLYLDHIGTSGIVKTSQALVTLIRKWNRYQPPKPASVLDAFTQTLQDITMIVVSAKYKSDTNEALLCFYLATRWLAILPESLPEPPETSAQEHNYVLEALAFLIVSLATTERGLEALSQKESNQALSDTKSSTKVRTSIRKSIDKCLARSPNLSSASVERLGEVAKHLSMVDDNSSQAVAASSQASEMQALQFQVSITDTQIVASKAATLVYLENLLLTGQTIDDSVVVSFLTTRHQNDHQSAFTDLFTSSFQILKNQSALPDTKLSQEHCKFFIQNKLPVILSMMSASSFNSFNVEQTLSEAWHQVTSTLPSPDLVATGHRCLHVCSLLHLMTSQTVSQLFAGGDSDSQSWIKGLPVKDELVAQVHSNAAKGTKLVDELVRGQGSAGPISQAIVEIMHSYCQSKETQYLKDLANAILRKPTAINCISLFVRPAYWLSPLCAILDDWRWDEIHGEAQPVYDEFGAVFLLILVTKSALNLGKSDIGIRKKDGFLAEYLDRENSEYAMSELSEEKSKHLGDWLNALYIAEGLSDELFTDCSPHDFYLLIPTLLRQSITAHQYDKLSSESLHAGLDYLLEPSLLPSLISGLNWVGNVLPDSPTLAGTVLEVLIKSPSNTESQEVHQTIVAKSASNLIKKIESGHYQDDKLDAAVKVLLQSPEFSLGSENQFASISSGDVLSSLQNSITTLLNPIANLDIDTTASPSTRYTPSMIHAAIHTCDPGSTLHTLMSVLLQFSESHNFVFALDMISTIISSSEPSLRDALRLQYSTLSKLLKRGDTLYAEAVVRVYRQVEVYSTILVVPDINLDPFAFSQPLPNMDTADASLDVAVAAAAASGAAGTTGVATDQNNQQTAMDMDLPDVNGGENPEDSIDQVLNEAAAMDGLKDSMDAMDGDLSWDALYGDGSNDMGLEDLDALDLDMDMF